MGLDDESPELLARGNPLWQREPAVGGLFSEGEESLMVSQVRLLLCYL